MRIATFLAKVLGIVVAAIGVLGVVAPSVLLEVGRSVQTTDALYIVAAVRVARSTGRVSVARPSAGSAGAR
jgi:hypothetical protein